MLRKFLITAVAGLLAASCSPKSQSGSGKLKVVTTVTMVADVVKQVGGDRVEIQGLMGAGVDPHNYVPKLGDASLLEKADVVFYSGLHLEGKMTETLEAMAKRGRIAVAVAEEGIPADRLLAPQEGFEGTKDPHVWGDPGLWIHTIEPVVEALSKADPAGAEEYKKRGEAYHQELEKLLAWANGRIGEIPQGKRALVTSHDAFFYFGRAFGFEVKGLQGVSTVTEAGIKDRAELVSFIKGRGIRTLFAESSVNSKGIAAVAEEAGAKISDKTLFSDAMGELGEMETVNGETYDMGTYTGMVKHNINSIVEGLK